MIYGVLQESGWGVKKSGFSSLGNVWLVIVYCDTVICCWDVVYRLACIFVSKIYN